MRAIRARKPREIEKVVINEGYKSPESKKNEKVVTYQGLSDLL
jgi:hypothetical protein